MPWYWETAKGVKEAAELRQAFPSLKLCLDYDNRSALVQGILLIAADVGYSVVLELPSDYPTGIPVLRIQPEEISWIADRHVNEKNGEACLCVRSECRLHWPVGSSLAAFIERLVRPFFAAQFYYETHGTWPIDAARSHGKDGVIEAYRELTSPLGNSSLDAIEKLMRLLSRKGHPKGHELCPCGSGLRLRKCHSQVVQLLRSNISPEHAQADLETTFPSR